MAFENNSMLGFFARLNWKSILIVTSLLMGIHLLLSAANFEQPEFGALPGPADQNDHPNPTNPLKSPAGDTYQPGAETASEKSEEEHAAESKGNHPGSSSTVAPDDAIPQDEYVAICMSVKDQPLDLPEFFVHHYNHIGIRRFYIMDDGSDPPLSDMPVYGVPSTVLTFDYQELESFGGNHYRQLAIYARCVEKYGHLHTWMAFLDGDEFLETPGPETLREVLTSFEKNQTVGALGVNWRMHTSSGLLTRPDSARKSFVTCHWDNAAGNNENSDNIHIKSIAKTSKFDSAENPHKMRLKDGALTVGENGDVIDTIAFRSPITRNRVGLHHYAIKSREEYEAKIHRGNAMDDPKGEDFWTKMEVTWPHEHCPEMAVYDP